MEFLPGGDLYSLLQQAGSIEEPHARVYAAQIVAALRSLRVHDIIHRDLKPDNILIAANGAIKLTDFGLSYSGVVDRVIPDDAIATADSIVGTPDYLAPEIVHARPHGFTADYWSLGVIIYEFLVGIPPFHADTPGATFANIVRGEFDFEDCEISSEARDLISKLLIVDPAKRLGANGIGEIEDHPWFAGIDWNEVSKLPPPFVPDIQDGTSTAYFQQRYSFELRVEDSIRDDIRDSKKAGGSARGRRESREGVPTSVSDTVLLRDFESVAVRQLSQFNQEVAQTMIFRRSPSSPSDLVPTLRGPELLSNF
jgi:serine/threonine protein kinase